MLLFVFSVMEATGAKLGARELVRIEEARPDAKSWDISFSTH
jgi:hypothetical protein